MQSYVVSTICSGLSNLTTAEFFVEGKRSITGLRAEGMGRRSPTQRYGSEVCTTQGHTKMQLEILTLTFKKIVSYRIAGPGVALRCIQTQMVARGAVAEMLCLGVNSPTSAPAGDQANGSCGQQQLEGHMPSAEHNLK